MMSDFEVQLGEAMSPSDFYVRFPGPKESPVTNQSYNEASRSLMLSVDLDDGCCAIIV